VTSRKNTSVDRTYFRELSLNFSQKELVSITNKNVQIRTWDLMKTKDAKSATARSVATCWCASVTPLLAVHNPLTPHCSAHLHGRSFIQNCSAQNATSS